MQAKTAGDEEQRALRALQIKQIMASLGRGEAEEGRAGEAAAQRKLESEARIRNYDEPNRGEMKVEDPIDMALRRREAEARIGKLGRDPTTGGGGSEGVFVKGEGGGGYYPRTGRSVEPPSGFQPPLTAIMKQSEGMAQALSDGVKKMETLAGEVTSGPIAGRVSKAGQRFFGPSGDEGDFDFLGNQMVDLVYLKSGKQINETEIVTLRDMIPDRARGHLPKQVELWKKYADTLLAKYGVEGLGGQPDIGAPTAPGQPGASAPKTGAGTRLKFNPATGELE
jgi:hypothetical protein